jgi:plastocyanin
MNRRLSSILASTTLALAACSGGSGTSAPTQAPAPSTAASPAGGGAVCSPSTEAGTVAAEMSGVAFVPATVAAKVGDVIVWTNNDTVPHTATYTDDPACTTPNLDGGATGGLSFSAAGTYAFFCKVHPSMTGTIEVTS